MLRIQTIMLEGDGSGQRNSEAKDFVVEDLISFLCCFSFSVQRGEKTRLAGKTQLPIN